MADYRQGLSGKVALVTGAGQRIGAAIVRSLHAQGMNVAVHYRRSREPAEALAADLEGRRPGSVTLLQAELTAPGRPERLVEKALARWGHLDVLVNNASTFYPTPVGTVSEETWNDLTGTNLKVPLLLSQAAAPHLRASRGCIVNLADIHGLKPLKGHLLYSVAKAGLVMLTRGLARELGPEVRVNAVAPGAILWPEQGMDEVARQRILSRTALKRQGEPDDVARAVLFLVRDADYITGQVIPVDGGRTVTG